MPQTTIAPAEVKTKVPALTLYLSLPCLIIKSAHGLMRKDK